MPALAVKSTSTDEASVYPEEVLQAGWNPDVQRLQLALQPALQSADQARDEPVSESAAPEPLWGAQTEVA